MYEGVCVCTTIRVCEGFCMTVCVYDNIYVRVCMYEGMCVCMTIRVC